MGGRRLHPLRRYPRSDKIRRERIVRGIVCVSTKRFGQKQRRRVDAILLRGQQICRDAEFCRIDRQHELSVSFVEALGTQRTERWCLNS